MGAGEDRGLYKVIQSRPLPLEALCRFWVDSSLSDPESFPWLTYSQASGRCLGHLPLIPPPASDPQLGVRGDGEAQAGAQHWECKAELSGHLLGLGADPPAPGTGWGSASLGLPPSFSPPGTLECFLGAWEVQDPCLENEGG